MKWRLEQKISGICNHEFDQNSQIHLTEIIVQFPSQLKINRKSKPRYERFCDWRRVSVLPNMVWKLKVSPSMSELHITKTLVTQLRESCPYQSLPFKGELTTSYVASLLSWLKHSQEIMPTFSKETITLRIDVSITSASPILGQINLLSAKITSRYVITAFLQNTATQSMALNLVSSTKAVSAGKDCTTRNIFTPLFRTFFSVYIYFSHLLLVTVQSSASRKSR